MSTSQWDEFPEVTGASSAQGAPAPAPPPALTPTGSWDEFPEASLDHDFNPINMMRNAPASATNAFISTVSPFFDGQQTMEILWGLVEGGASKAYRKANEFIKGKDIEPYEAEKHVDAVIDYVTDRYGGIENIQRTLEEDPAGLFLDFAAGGRGANIATKGKTPSTRGLIEKRVQKMDPVGDYESVAKFTTTATPEQRKQWATTALEQNLSPKPSHVELLDTRINDFGTEVRRLIAEADAAGTEVPVDAVFKYLKELRAELGGPKFEGGADLQTIDKAIASFRQHMQDLGKDTMTPAELQAFKQDLYKRINWNRRTQTNTPAGEETMKNVARATKDIIEDEVPGTGALNEQMAELLDLKEPFSRASARIANRRKFGLMSAVGLGSGSALGVVLAPIIGTGPAAVLTGIIGGASLMATPKNMAALARAKFQIQKAMEQHKGIGTSQRVMGDLAHAARLIEETQQYLEEEQQ